MEAVKPKRTMIIYAFCKDHSGCGVDSRLEGAEGMQIDYLEHIALMQEELLMVERLL